MGKLWKYAVALLGVWFVICNQYSTVPMAYNTSATYNYRVGLIHKHTRFAEAPLTVSNGKGSRQVHHTIKRWLKENEAFTFDIPVSFSLISVPVGTRSRFFISQESFRSSTHRLTSLRGPPTV